VDEKQKCWHYFKTEFKPIVHPFNVLFSRTTGVSWYQKGKPFWILMKQEVVAVTSAGTCANHLHLTPDR